MTEASPREIDFSDIDFDLIGKKPWISQQTEGIRKAFAGAFACAIVGEGCDAFHAVWSFEFLKGLIVDRLNLAEDNVVAISPLTQLPSRESCEQLVVNSGSGSESAAIAAFTDATRWHPCGKTDPAPFIHEIGGKKALWQGLRDLVVLMVVTKKYDARARAAFKRLASFGQLNWAYLARVEELLAAAMSRELSKHGAEEDRKAKGTKGKSSKSSARWLKVGAAAVVGGGLLVLTGGLAAGGLVMGLGALGAAGGTLGTAALYLGSIITYLGGTAGITAIFGATGFGLAGSKMAKRTEGIKEFEFKLLRGEQRLPVFVFVSGFLRPRQPKSRLIAAVGGVFDSKSGEEHSATSSSCVDGNTKRAIETEQSSFLATSTLRAGHWQPWGGIDKQDQVYQVTFSRGNRDAMLIRLGRPPTDLGMRLQQVGRQLFVSKVEPGGLADGHGVLVGSEILTLNGVPVAQLKKRVLDERPLVAVLKARTEAEAEEEGEEEEQQGEEEEEGEEYQEEEEEEEEGEGEKLGDEEDSAQCSEASTANNSQVRKPGAMKERLAKATALSLEDGTALTEVRVLSDTDEAANQIAELKELYKLHNPEKLNDGSVEKLLEKYTGRETLLVSMVRDKYCAGSDTSGIDGSTGTVSGTKKPKQRQPWPLPHGEQNVLLWCSNDLTTIGSKMAEFGMSDIADVAATQAIKTTVLASVYLAVALPVTILKTADAIDNPWTIVSERAEAVGKLLAQTLLERRHGVRPVTLCGFSMGARVIFFCLKELNKAGKRGRGIIEDAVLVGAAVSRKKDAWAALRGVVGGRFINGYSSKDWILKVLYRYQSWELAVAGIAPVEVPGVENVDLSHLISRHLDYRKKMPEILNLLQLEGDVVQSHPPPEEQAAAVVTASSPPDPPSLYTQSTD